MKDATSKEREREQTLSYLGQIPNNIHQQIKLAEFSSELIKAKCGLVWETSISGSCSLRWFMPTDPIGRSWMRMVAERISRKAPLLCRPGRGEQY